MFLLGADFYFDTLTPPQQAAQMKVRVFDLAAVPLVQDIVGHANAETTRRICEHLELDDERRALAQLRFRLPAGNGPAPRRALERPRAASPV